MQIYCVEVLHGSKEYQETIGLRDQLLRKPLGLSFREEDLATETDSFHLAAYNEQKELLACLVLKPLGGKAIKMRQVATSPKFQGNGIGKKLVLFAESFASEKGFDTMVLHARKTAVLFYDKLRYQKEGDIFEEVSIPHQKMLKQLE